MIPMVSADLTQLIAKENNFDIDMKSFNDYMEKQKNLQDLVVNLKT